MGMDGIAIVLRIEETFGINITNEEAAELTTPRKLTDFVMTQVEKSDQAICLSQQAFHRLRRAFTEELCLPRSAFRPSARIEEFFPLQHRRRDWQAVESSIALASWPALLPPKWVRSARDGITVIGILSGFLLFLLFVGIVDPLWKRIALALFTLLAVPYFAIKVAEAMTYLAHPLRCEFPVITVADLVRYLVAMNPSAFRPGDGWTRESVAAAIRRILIEEAGVEEFNEDDDFVRDLGID